MSTKVFVVCYEYKISEGYETKIHAVYIDPGTAENECRMLNAQENGAFYYVEAVDFFQYVAMPINKPNARI